MSTATKEAQGISFEQFKEGIINDYKLAVESREASLLGRREVLTGKAKFGIFGDGKELAQIAMARVFENGDFRSGYYRDQTFMMAIGQLSIQEMFAALYAHTNVQEEPASAGRQMGGHFSTRSLDENGNWKDLTAQKNSSSDISPTAGQMPRLVGLAQASKIYRHVDELKGENKFSKNGNEIAFGTIGNASTSEGPFFEAINAAGVLQIPMLMSVWDDRYGISVPAKYQTTKESISEILAGFQRTKDKPGYEILTVNGWDYPALVETYEKAAAIAREEHVPVLVHVMEMTQPQGHSTSGSHERYKSPERLQWEQDFDCIAKMKEWMISSGIADENELKAIDKEAKKTVRLAKTAAWSAYLEPITNAKAQIVELLAALASSSSNSEAINGLKSALEANAEPLYKDCSEAARKALRITRSEPSTERENLKNWLSHFATDKEDKYNSLLFSSSEENARNIAPVAPEYADDAEMVDARLIIRDNFDKILGSKPEVLIFGEDSGNIGDVNQGLEGMQEKYGELRVSDVGIRECTILGQGIGMAMRGLRPIAEIQYLDYLLYALQIMSDDLATVQYRTKGGQKAPVIVRTRGHRLEGIWHSGSPMGMILNAVRGIHVLVPRNMTQAAGFYNTMLASDEPALIVECLNGYRLKEKMPSNLGEFKTPIGVVETLREGTDFTIVSYGSTLRQADAAINDLADLGISVELIDVQSLLPFDEGHQIVESIKKTNRVLFLDEDVPGGATAFMMQKVLEEQEAYKYLDAQPATLTAKAHRPPYGTDGDYYTKPSVDDIVEKIYSIMHEGNPSKFPEL